jgi:hypothetical protein
VLFCFQNLPTILCKVSTEQRISLIVTAAICKMQSHSCCVRLAMPLQEQLQLQEEQDRLAEQATVNSMFQLLQVL